MGISADGIGMQRGYTKTQTDISMHSKIGNQSHQSISFRVWSPNVKTNWPEVRVSTTHTSVPETQEDSLSDNVGTTAGKYGRQIEPSTIGVNEQPGFNT